mmetsp:Transcript_654/g.2385  ORF Transcript_654/g.2385 Transcript_654/m.2385 type:complete len:399 (+) Transcript_654:224-1420(+)
MDRNMSLRRGCSLSVAMVFFLFGYIYSVTAFTVILPWMQYTVKGIVHLGVLTSLTLTGLFSYCLTVIVHPGEVPRDYCVDAESGSPSMVEVKRKRSDKGKTQSRFCSKCQLPKPPRAHHCRICKKCVLRMDHHCVWVNNCVGHRNYKFFLLFLAYSLAAILQCTGLTFMYAVHNPMGSGDHYRRAPRTTARTKIPNSTVRVYSSTQARAASAALAVSAAMAQRQEYLDARARSRIEEQEIHNVDHHDVGFALNTSTPSLVGASGTYGMHDKYASRVESSKRSRAKSHRRSSEQPTTSTLLQVAMMCINIPLILGLGLLFGWHCYLVWTNRTTIEFHDGVRAKWLNSQGQRLSHPYDLGACDNLFEILGPDPWTWCVPCTRLKHDGLSFPSIADKRCMR